MKTSYYGCSFSVRFFKKALSMMKSTEIGPIIFWFKFEKSRIVKNLMVRCYKLLKFVRKLSESSYYISSCSKSKLFGIRSGEIHNFFMFLKHGYSSISYSNLHLKFSLLKQHQIAKVSIL